ncbi:MAG TPA: universal stress protein [Hyphomicrobiaceae bacterium]|nr:universal stress protein [Hyphomicrobiaceae bacterium]
MLFKHILIPTDGSELSLKAVRHGVALAKAMGAQVTAMTVQPPFTDFVVEGVTITVGAAKRDELTNQFDHRMDAAREEAKAQDVHIGTIQVEDREPWRAIIEVAKKKNADLIVMASHGRRGVSAMVLGSETQKLLTHSTVPVLVYR